MAGAIYKIWRGNATEAWYRLTKEEQDKLMAKVEEALEKAGGRVVVTCRSDWANEKWHTFGVEEFTDIEAVQRNHILLNELNWFRYIESESQLGTAWEP